MAKCKGHVKEWCWPRETLPHLYNGIILIQLDKWLICDQLLLFVMSWKLTTFWSILDTRTFKVYFLMCCKKIFLKIIFLNLSILKILKQRFLLVADNDVIKKKPMLFFPLLVFLFILQCFGNLELVGWEFTIFW